MLAFKHQIVDYSWKRGNEQQTYTQQQQQQQNSPNIDKIK